MQAVVKGSILQHSVNKNIIYVDNVTSHKATLSRYAENNVVEKFSRTLKEIQQFIDNGIYAVIDKKQQYVMVTHEFGQPVYIAPSEMPGIKITDSPANAQKWNWKDTVSCKLAYHIAVTGYKELNFEPCNNFQNIPEWVKSCAVADCATLEQFLIKYMKPEKYTGRGKDYENAVLKMKADNLALNGYVLLSSHSNITNEIISFIPLSEIK